MSFTCSACQETWDDPEDSFLCETCSEGATWEMVEGPDPMWDGFGEDSAWLPQWVPHGAICGNCCPGHHADAEG